MYGRKRCGCVEPLLTVWGHTFAVQLVQEVYHQATGHQAQLAVVLRTSVYHYKQVRVVPPP